MSGVKLRQRDNGAKALLKRMESARTRKRVELGVFEEEAARDDGGEATNMDIAAFAEFGTSGSPPRPWLSGWADEHDADNRVKLRKIGEAIVKGTIQNLETGLEQFGLYARGSIQQRIRAGVPPPNEPSTIARKGSSTPLVNTGQFWSSVTYRVLT